MTIKKKNILPHWKIYLILGIIGSITFLRLEDSLARVAWKKHFPNLALHLVRNDAELVAQLGQYYFNGGTYDLGRAELAYQKALTANPKIRWGHYQLARIYLVEGSLEQALSEINQELIVNPENLRSLYIRGLIYGQRGDLDSAEADFKSFVAWAPKEWAGYNDLIWIVSREGKYKVAEEFARKAFQEVPNAEANPWLWNSLGLSQLNLGDKKNARISFKKARDAAKKLTAESWVRAYPGNNPDDAVSGLNAFRDALEKNILETERVDNSI